jgi:hypothetical protein
LDRIESSTAKEDMIVPVRAIKDRVVDLTTYLSNWIVASTRR